MATIGEYVKSSDWKTEKHVPTIAAPSEVKPGEPFEVALVVGREVPHPNTTEHNIRWIELYFKPSGPAPIFNVGRYEFGVHGESGKGPNQGPVHAVPSVKAVLTLKQSGTLHALAFCNIHGLWESSAQIAVE